MSAADKVLQAQSHTTLSGENTIFKSFVARFAAGEQTGPAIKHDLAAIVNELLTDKLTKDELESVQDKYLKPRIVGIWSLLK